eukprot:TRINITY_DN15542_c0_g1_i1.p1 TRINITY_DN15542_c0_g1~~TRINITY_DN15542_c0_g1_i1.p1  ORF type:complete len:442 (-),score=78.43 TRINITY_DN15542_c0_g1_i1:69-1394(-)
MSTFFALAILAIAACVSATTMTVTPITFDGTWVSNQCEPGLGNTTGYMKRNMKIAGALYESQVWYYDNLQNCQTDQRNYMFDLSGIITFGVGTTQVPNAVPVIFQIGTFTITPITAQDATGFNYGLTSHGCTALPLAALQKTNFLTYTCAPLNIATCRQALDAAAIVNGQLFFASAPQNLCQNNATGPTQLSQYPLVNAYAPTLQGFYSSACYQIPNLPVGVIRSAVTFFEATLDQWAIRTITYDSGTCTAGTELEARITLSDSYQVWGPGVNGGNMVQLSLSLQLFMPLSPNAVAYFNQVCGGQTGFTTNVTLYELMATTNLNCSAYGFFQLTTYCPVYYDTVFNSGAFYQSLLPPSLQFAAVSFANLGSGCSPNTRPNQPGAVLNSLIVGNGLTPTAVTAIVGVVVGLAMLILVSLVCCLCCRRKSDGGSPAFSKPLMG